MPSRNAKQGAAKLTVYHLNHSRSLRLLWLLEHLKLEYEVVTFERNEQTKLAPPEAKKIHALGRFPILTIEENGDKLTLAETSAIMIHLVERYGDSSLLPDTSNWAARHRVQYWVAYAEDSIMSPLMYAVVFAQLPKQGPFIARPLLNAVSYGANSVFIRPLINEHLRWVESQLADSDYLGASKLTLADFMMHFPVDGAKTNFILPQKAKYPNLLAYLERLEKEPAYQRAVQRGGGSNDFSVFLK